MYEKVKRNDAEDSDDGVDEQSSVAQSVSTTSEWKRGPFQFSVAKATDPNEDVKFEDAPIRCFCPFCCERIVSHVELQNGWLTFVFMFFTLFIFGWLAICILPLFWPIFQQSVHFCPRCYNTVAKRHRIHVPSVDKDIMTVKCGSCAIVVARKFFVALGIMLFFIFGFAMLRWSGWILSREVIVEGPHISKSWTEFAHHCSFRSYLGNPIHATTAFNDLFRDKTVTWEGKVSRIREGGLPWLYNHLFLEMNPPQFPSVHHLPDLTLSFNDTLNEQVSEISMGDLLEFNATLVRFGRRGAPHYGHMWAFKVVARAATANFVDEDPSHDDQGEKGDEIASAQSNPPNDNPPDDTANVPPPSDNEHE